PRAAGALRPGWWRAALWGAFAAALPVFAIGKFQQAGVLAPVGAAIGATLAIAARAGAGVGNSGWLAAARLLHRAFLPPAR
ncbi:MAG: hypothetical protein WHT08_15350, partial [Bryobacteraceae bacterium]